MAAIRVQIPAYTDRWMMGDRLGELVKTTKYRGKVTRYHGKDIAHVKLDISGKTIKVLLDDVTIVG